MAWTSPMTAIAGSIFTAAQFNQNVRDNLNETAPAKVTASGQLVVGAAANSVAARTLGTGYVLTSETTASTTYTALTTAGPSDTATSGAAALVAIACATSNTGANSTLMSFAVSGASTVAASDDFAVFTTGTSGGTTGMIFLVSGLTPGSNIFTAQYRVTGGTGTYSRRRMVVIPL